MFLPLRSSEPTGVQSVLHTGRSADVQASRGRPDGARGSAPRRPASEARRAPLPARFARPRTWRAEAPTASIPAVFEHLGVVAARGRAERRVPAPVVAAEQLDRERLGR